MLNQKFYLLGRRGRTSFLFIITDLDFGLGIVGVGVFTLESLAKKSFGFELDFSLLLFADLRGSRFVAGFSDTLHWILSQLQWNSHNHGWRNHRLCQLQSEPNQHFLQIKTADVFSDDGTLGGHILRIFHFELVGVGMDSIKLLRPD